LAKQTGGLEKFMLAAGKWVLGVVTGGIALGAWLGSAANPEMKNAPAPWWQLVGRAEVVASSAGWSFEAGPDDLSPASGYRPDFDYDAEAVSAPIPAYELAALNEQPLAAPVEEMPTVSYGVAAAEEVAEEAEAAAVEAQAAEEPEPELQPEVRQAELASAGLY
jgi:hypothetical protein